MGITNFGNQILGQPFGLAATSLLVNFNEYKVVPPGIYKGGSLTKLSANQISVAPLVCYITDDVNSVGCRIETTVDVTLTVSSATPYIVGRFTWVNSSINFMDILAVGSGSLLTDDLIIGRCIYIGATLQSIFDYTQRNNGWSVLLGSKETELKVTPNDPVTNTLNVAAGTYLSGKGFVSIIAGISPIFQNTTLGRYDLLYVDSTGALQISQGVDSGSPSAPDYQGQVVIAEIHRGANRTTVRGDEIIPVKARRYSIDQNTSIDSSYLNFGTGSDQIQGANFSIIDSQQSIIATTVENALLELNIVKSFTVDANELNTINPGNVVSIFNDKIRLYQETPVMGATQTIFTTGGTALNELSQDTLAPGVIICAFYNIASPNSAVKVTIITTSGKVATPNTVYEIENFTNSPSASGVNKLSVKAINATTAILMYEGGNSGSSTGRAVILTITGTVITWTPGNIISFNTGGTSNINGVMLDSTHALVVYKDIGTSNKTTSMILTISGSTISAGAKSQPDATVRSLYRLKYLFKGASSGNHICMILWDNGTNVHTNQIQITSLFAITWNATDTNDVTTVTNKDQTFLFSKSLGLAYYITDAVPTTPQEINYTEGVFTSHIAEPNSSTTFIARGASGLEQSPNTHLLFGSNTTNGNKGTIMLYRWRNGIIFTSVPIVIVNNTISNYTRLSYIDQSHVLCIWMETTATLLKCAVMEVLNNYDTIIGLSLDTATAGQSCRVAIDGINNISGLVTDTIHYLTTSGNLTNDPLDTLLTEPARIIGKTIGATQFQICGANYS